jgi:hypothetical protein
MFVKLGLELQHTLTLGVITRGMSKSSKTASIMGQAVFVFMPQLSMPQEKKSYKSGTQILSGYKPWLTNGSRGFDVRTLPGALA